MASAWGQSWASAWGSAWGAVGSVLPGATNTLWSSADLLARCRLHSRRPATDQTMPDAAWYSFLTEAQPEVYSELFSRFPVLGYGPPILMTTADGGKTYTFASDAHGEFARPMAHLQVFENLEAVPDDPLEEGSDFIAEGDRIRIPNNQARTFSAGPYARVVLSPDVPISATYEPLLYPRPHRMLLVWKALAAWAARPGSGVDPAQYELKYQQRLNAVFLELATAYNRGGLARWWTMFELGFRPSGGDGMPLGVY